MRSKVVVTRVVLALLAGFFAASAALAEGNAEAGRSKAEACLGCHGIAGYRNAYPSYRVPKVGGQSEAYIVAALKAYRAGDRAHPTMLAQAASLSDDDIADIAAYFSSHPDNK